ncbi:MAG: DUF3859 domain-containing protein, partial [Verrucomicrobiota bacterium]
MKHCICTSLFLGLSALLLSGFFKFKPNKADIINFGIMTYESEEIVDNPNTVSGTESFMDEIRWVERTDQIPAKLGVSFGVEYIIRGNPSHSIDVVEVIIFPGTGLTNPETGKTLKESPYP